MVVQPYKITDNLPIHLQFVVVFYTGIEKDTLCSVIVDRGVWTSVHYLNTEEK